MMENKLKKSKGFTLIELLIAMSIISLIVMAFFTVWNSTIRLSAKNEKDIKSLNIAQSEVENIRNQIKEQIDSTTKSITVNAYQTSSNSYMNDSITIGTEKEYKKKIEGDSNLYTVKLIVKKDPIKDSSNKETSNFIYNINVKVQSNNQNLSKKIIELETEVFGK
ncbi:type II secretion system protein [Romboutsia sp.]|uniref:type II secretion system protein n=1 Tax=Romboutsia sp. TaxID=1965302 RepID=UPI003F3991FA